MKNSKPASAFYPWLIYAGLLFAGGCGSGGGTAPALLVRSASVVTSTPSAALFQGTGRAQATVVWAGASQSVLLTLTQNGQTLPGTTRLVTRPATGESTEIWNVPTGDVLLSAAAYESSDGSGAVSQQANVVLVIEDGSTKSVTLTPETPQNQTARLVITTGGLVPATSENPVTIYKGDELLLAAAAVDRANRVLLTTNKTYSWTSDAPGAPVRASAGMTNALLAQSPTIAQVSVAESLGGAKAFVSVPVTGFSIQRADLGYTIGRINSSGWVLGLTRVQTPPYNSSLPIQPSGDSSLSPAGLNDAGQIVGNRGFPFPSDNSLLVQAHPMTPFLWQASTGLTFLTTTTGETVVRPYAINNAGQILISYAVTENGLPKTGTGVLNLETGRVMRLPLDALQIGSTGSIRVATLTDGGQVVGLGLPLPGRVVSATTGSVQSITPLSGDTFTDAADGNAAGVIVGDSSEGEDARYYFDKTSHALFWTSMGGTIALPAPQNALHSGASAINKRGDIVGYADFSERRAILWRNNQPRDINKMLIDRLEAPPYDGVSPFFYEGVAVSDTNRIIALNQTGTRVLVPVTGKAGE